MKPRLLILFACLLFAGSLHAQNDAVTVGPTQNKLVQPVELWTYASGAWARASAGGGSSSSAVSTTTNDLGPITVTTTSATALAASTRLNAAIVNYGTTGCFISLTGTAAVGKGIYLAPNGGSYGIDANNLYRGVISAITASGTTTLSIHEGQ